jgi:ribosome biogenesis protein SSF1/2
MLSFLLILCYVVPSVTQNKKAKKAKAAAEAQAREEVFAKAPHSFIFSRGKVGRVVRQLVRDLRRVYEPYTATNLRVNQPVSCV